MQSVDKPSFSQFGQRGKNGWAVSFVLGLTQGEPKALPDQHQDESARAALYNAAKSRNIKVATLTYGDKIWAARIA